jgi:hypothetical protein
VVSAVADTEAEAGEVRAAKDIAAAAIGRSAAAARV